MPPQVLYIGEERLINIFYRYKLHLMKLLCSLVDQSQVGAPGNFLRGWYKPVLYVSAPSQIRSIFSSCLDPCLSKWSDCLLTCLLSYLTYPLPFYQKYLSSELQHFLPKEISSISDFLSIHLPSLQLEYFSKLTIRLWYPFHSLPGSFI